MKAKKKTTAAGPPTWLSAWTRRAPWIAAAAVALATVRIVATYGVYNHTFDEPTHIATGMEWLDKHSYTWETQHPPLARVATAIGPYLLGRRTRQLPKPGSKDPNDNKEHEGTAILYQGHDYERTLTAARLGILPFFWIACAVVWGWTRRSYGAGAAAMAVAIFTFLPPVLAHAGLATTDMALTAMVGAAFLAGMVWIERPDAARSALFGAAVGLAVLTKFSALAFLPATVSAALAAWWWAERPKIEVGRRPVWLAMAAAIAVVVIWSAYRFSFREFFDGIDSVREHNRIGNATYFFGELAAGGRWYFFPVMLALKTPLALLAGLTLWAAVTGKTGLRRMAVPLAFSGAILLVGMAANINLGVRHVLPVYIGLAIAAGAGLMNLLEEAGPRKWMAPVLGALALWFAGSSVAAHPDYLPYFNELAGGAPEKIVVDSDLEWGQDLNRVSARLRQLGADRVTVMTELVADFEREHGFPPTSTNMDGARPPAGWTAIDVTYWKQRRLGLGLAGARFALWPDRVPPVEKVGAGYYLWYFPPAR